MITIGSTIRQEGSFFKEMNKHPSTWMKICEIFVYPLLQVHTTTWICLTRNRLSYLVFALNYSLISQFDYKILNQGIKRKSESSNIKNTYYNQPETDSVHN